MPEQTVYADEELTVRILYQNHRGEIGWRVVRPLTLWFGGTQWHPEPQWLLKAFDCERQAERDFAMHMIHEWKPFNPAKED